MKNSILKYISVTPLLLILLLSISGCHDTCTETRTYLKYTPIKKAPADIRESFEVLPPVELVQPGKIFAYGNTLFIVDRGIGFHIVDNSNPESPVYTHFVKLDGCQDVAMKDNTLYANQGADIIAISTNGEPTIQNRIKNILNNGVEQDSIIVSWNATEVTEVVETDCNSGQNSWNNGRQNLASNEANAPVSFGVRGTSASAPSSQGTTGGNTTGLSGSMSRFSIVENSFYVVSNSELSSYDILSGFTLQSRTEIGGGIETVFGTNEYLYIGSTTGMFIYDRNQGNTPSFISRLRHARGCDPVVVQGDYAFVTLRGNNECGQADNGLYVVDITDVRAPILHSMHPMVSPHGLGVKDDYIMICDGQNGLRVFDKSNLNAIGSSELSSDNSVNAYDVIIQDNMAILSAQEGVFQYDLSNPKDLRQISTLIAR